ncbi:hypothetical protein A0H81_05218 [Grifola frondosa]|uniref:DUF6533 domain-containing protein n=1 Tax=Grifola frondosa TaxID=5627 RepID=A0A1C7MD34_GRIFR|nr:hypothetical protein A0H81_05218 [Grifola frondosa]
MSSEDESIQAVITLLSYVPSGDRFDIACAALVVYEYILTFPLELHVIWGHKLRGAAVLFILNRYITVVYAILIIVLSLGTWRTGLFRNLLMILFLPNSCSAVGYTAEVISCIQCLILGVFSALRVYAIGASGWWAASVAILMGITPVAIYIV